MGRQRQHNEDSFLVENTARLFLVADGMGGHAAGEIASRIAVDSISEFILHTKEDDGTWPHAYDEHFKRSTNRLMAAVRMANTRVLEAMRKDARLRGMGTTVVACDRRRRHDVVRARRRLARLPDPRQRAHPHHQRSLLGVRAGAGRNAHGSGSGEASAAQRHHPRPRRRAAGQSRRLGDPGEAGRRVSALFGRSHWHGSRRRDPAGSWRRMRTRSSRVKSSSTKRTNGAVSTTSPRSWSKRSEPP